jgi:ubiquinone/menaquinone biosynthesis C-methylase UbiE
MRGHDGLGESLGRFTSVDASGAPETFIRMLDVMSQTAADRKRRTYELMRIEPGMTVLDVGCGPGGDVRAMAAIVAPGGVAIGVDRSAAMLAEARKRTVDLEADVSYVRADAAALGLAAESVDAARCERVLEHSARPGTAVAELARVVRRGGHVVAYEPDWGGLLLDVPSPATQDVIALIGARIASPCVGRELRRYFRDAGLTDLQIIPDVWTLTDFDLAADLLRLDDTLDAGVRQGVLDVASADAWRTEARRAGVERRFFGALTFFIAVGEKR